MTHLDLPDYAYALGRARGACYLRTEPTERDDEWLAEKVGTVDDDAAMDAALVRFAEGMLDGCDQVQAVMIGVRWVRRRRARRRSRRHATICDAVRNRQRPEQIDRRHLARCHRIRYCLGMSKMSRSRIDRVRKFNAALGSREAVAVVDMHRAVEEEAERREDAIAAEANNWIDPWE